MEMIKRIALVAHDNRKKDLLEWVIDNQQSLIAHRLISTGTTGRLIEEALSSGRNNVAAANFELLKLKSGPLGGDQQLGAMISSPIFNASYTAVRKDYSAYIGRSVQVD